MFANSPKIVISSEMHEFLRDVFHRRLTPGGVALTYLASRAFGVVRYPTRPDRSVDSRNDSFKDVVAYLDTFTEEKWERLSLELLDIKKRTGEILFDVTGSANVNLVRFIELPPQPNIPTPGDQDDLISFTLLTEASKQAGLPTITIDMDILSGWSKIGSSYYGQLKLTRAWQIDDVLLVSELLTSERGQQPLEDDEWICINRHPSGLVQFPIEHVVVEKLPNWCIDKLSRQKAISALADQLQGLALVAPHSREFALRCYSLATHRAISLASNGKPKGVWASILRAIKRC